MYKFFKLIFQFLIILIAAIFILNNSFLISFEINDYIFSFSSSYFFISFLFIFSIIFFVQSFFFKLKFNFSKFKISKKIKNKEIGYNSFVKGMIAISNKDYKKAINEGRKVSQYLDDKTPLSLLLRSEVYKIEKKYDELNKIYDEMAKHEETKSLAYRGLMERFLSSQDYHHAFIYGEKLFYINPYIEKIYDTLINIIAKTNNWQQLINISEKAFSKKIINKKIYEENKSIGFYEIAKIKKFSAPNESIQYLEKSLKLRNNFPPYIKLYTELLIQNKSYSFAKKFLKKVWSNNPHPEYKSSILKLANHTKEKELELVKNITGASIQEEESKILLVEACILNNKWEEARLYIKELIDIQPKKRVCLLMAKIEEGDTADIQKVNAWTLRANNGEDNNMWVCMFSNKAQNEWSSLSKGGYFNSLEWKQIHMLN